MLQELSEQIRACHERAVEARRKAETALNPALKADFLEMEKRWLALARSYAFTERLQDFTAAFPLALLADCLRCPRCEPAGRVGTDQPELISIANKRSGFHGWIFVGGRTHPLAPR